MDFKHCMKVKCKNCDRQLECNLKERLMHRPFKELYYDTEKNTLCVARKTEKSQK